MVSNNPLKQYFRRPSIYIKLSSSEYDLTTLQPTPSDEYPVYPMTAIDEITSRTPDAVLNGNAVVDIIKSCVPNVLNPWNLTSDDVDTLLIAIRVASNGETIDINSNCPNCKEDLKFNTNLVKILGDRRKNDYTYVLTIRELSIKFKPLNYFESNKNGLLQYELQKNMYLMDQIENPEEKANQQQAILKQIQEQVNIMIAGTIEYIETPETKVFEREYINEFLLNCDRLTAQTIRDQAIKIKTESQIPPFKLKCIHCSHEYEQPLILNITDFFA